MKIKTLSLSDIPTWILLSKEYDRYVQELVSNLTEWYEGNESAISFDNYMQAKISKHEAFMATEKSGGCFGIAAISKTNNNITFFGIAHNYNFYEVGSLLLAHALSMLNAMATIKTNIIKSDAEQIQKQRTLFEKYGFVFSHDDIENGVPVSCMKKVRSGG
jgi:hypothetical protein